MLFLGRSLQHSPTTGKSSGSASHQQLACLLIVAVSVGALASDLCMRRKSTAVSFLVAAAAATMVVGTAGRVSPPSPQKVNKVEQGQAKAALHQIQEVIEKNYFDPAFHGFDLRTLRRSR